MSARAGASGSPSGAGIRSTIASSTSSTPIPVFAEMRRTFAGSSPTSSATSAAAAVGIGRGQVDLVHDRDDLEVVLDRQVGVRERLRLDPLRGVHEEERALARLERARHLVGEVDVTGRVDQVQLVALPLDADGLRLDRDAALALEIHRVEHLLAHLPLRERRGQLEDAVGERRLAVVDVRDDGEVADAIEAHEVRERLTRSRMVSSSLIRRIRAAPRNAAVAASTAIPTDAICAQPERPSASSRTYQTP